MKVVVSAGPTREKIDCIRFVSNRSSGKMGYAIAEAARAAGHEVVLVSGPTALPVPEGVEFMGVETTEQMSGAIKHAMGSADALIMAAAVADYRPKYPVSGKMKKGGGDLVLELERTEDILAAVGEMKRPGQLLIGFAAESDDLLANAEKKLRAKNLDWIVANDIGTPGIAFGADDNEAVLLGRDGERISLPRDSKSAVAAEIVRLLLK